MKKQSPKDQQQNIVTKSNNFVRYNKSALTLQEKKFINYALSRLDKEDLDASDFPKQTFTVDEYCETLGLNKNHFYEEMREISLSLLSKPFEIKFPDYKGTGKNVISYANWFQTCRYNVTDGSITVKFHEDIKTYFLQLQGEKTTYRLCNTLFAKNKYMPDWYELFQSYRSMKNCLIMTIDEIRDFLLISPDRYTSRNNDLVKNCIVDPIEEMNIKSDMRCEIKKICKGRKIIAIEFNYRNKNVDDIMEDLKRKRQNKKEA